MICEYCHKGFMEMCDMMPFPVERRQSSKEFLEYMREKDQERMKKAAREILEDINSGQNPN